MSAALSASFCGTRAGRGAGVSAWLAGRQRREDRGAHALDLQQLLHALAACALGADLLLQPAREVVQHAQLRHEALRVGRLRTGTQPPGRRALISI